jgi:hypothetical protein
MMREVVEELVGETGQAAGGGEGEVGGHEEVEAGVGGAEVVQRGVGFCDGGEAAEVEDRVGSVADSYEGRRG